MFEVVCFSENSELNALTAFMKWQGISFNAKISVESLKYTRGVPFPVLIKDGIELAIGYFKIVDWFVKNSFIRC